MPKKPAKKPAILDPQGRITVLLAEYHALYRLAEFRMGALDRRVPAAGAAIVAFLGSVPLLPERAGMIVLVAIPISVVWFVRTTINHARSLEDLLRAIEAAERAINRAAGTPLLAFQSNHPSRGKAVGGRTGFETVSAVGLAAAVLIGACAYLADTPGSATAVSILYMGYLVSMAGSILRWLVLWKRYRYK
tara:strand:- start:17259 stop:17831 length:573 start_codon:yes stop_codon:yes gene_type:complete